MVFLDFCIVLENINDKIQFTKIWKLRSARVGANVTKNGHTKHFMKFMMVKTHGLFLILTRSLIKIEKCTSFTKFKENLNLIWKKKSTGNLEISTPHSVKFNFSLNSPKIKSKCQENEWVIKMRSKMRRN